uniref:Ig-like domain-containing protein n=1 Tax=Gasterosteus aculeatus aculeatus TaxID=481459 RepID=A0AAQ4PQX8_GASAC
MCKRTSGRPTPLFWTRVVLKLTPLCVLPGRPVSSSCPVQISPPTVVVRFGDPLRIICSSTSDQIESIGLESRYGGEKTEGVSSVVLDITSVEHWEVLVICFLNRVKVDQCSENFPVTVYKAPDRVSISQPSLTAPLVEGETYSLKCDVVNVAPVQNLSVHWYKGEKILRTERFHGSSKPPVNATSVFNLTAQREDDQTRIRCEAQLDLDTVPSLPAIKSESRAVIVQSWLDLFWCFYKHTKIRFFKSICRLSRRVLMCGRCCLTPSA